MENVLEVTTVETVTSETTGRKFDRATFRAVTDFIGERTIFGSHTGARIYNEGGAPRVGDLMGGKVHKLETTPYTIGDNEVTSTSVVVFSDEIPLDVANRALARNNASVVVNGKATKNQYIASEVGSSLSK